jgi:PAS domain S-box-containing protein
MAEHASSNNNQVAGASQTINNLLVQGISCVKDYAIFLLDIGGHIISWNDGAKRMKGYTAEEIVGKHLSILYEQDARDQRFPDYELFEAKLKGRFEDEGWRLRRDGTKFWANIIITATFDQQGTHTGYVKVTRDLTERRKTEDSMKTLWKGISTITDYAIFSLDPQGYVVTWNEGAKRLKGYTAEEVIGKHFSLFFPKEAIDEQLPEKELAAAKRQGRYEDEKWRIRKGGVRFWANVIISAIYDDQRTHVGYLKVTRDLTERRTVEERLQTLQDGINAVSDYAIFMLDSQVCLSHAISFIIYKLTGLQ